MSNVLFSNTNNVIGNYGNRYPQFQTDTNWSQFPPIKSVTVSTTTKCYAFIIE